MTIHVQNITQLVRWYDVGSFEEKSEYAATATLLYENSHTVMVIGLTGQFNKKFYLLLWKYFNDNGITHMKIERKGEYIIKDVPQLTKDL